MPFFPFRAAEDIPLGEAPLPSTEPVRVHTPCGEWMRWDEASWHMLDCEACDETQKKNHFIQPGDFLARQMMGIKAEVQQVQQQSETRG